MFEKKVGRPSNEMVKKRRIFKVSMFLLAIAVIALVAGFTYARYKTSTTSTGTASIAQWNIALKDGSGQVLSSQNKVTITPIANEDVDTGKVAPGSQFQIQYQIDPTGTEVGVETSFTTFKTGFIDAALVNSMYSMDLSNYMLYNIVSASYTLDGVTTPITLSDYNDPTPVTVTMSGQPYMTIPITYTYPTSPIKVPLSKIASGSGLVTVTLVAEIASTELDVFPATDVDDAGSRMDNLIPLIVDDDFVIKLFAAQDTGDNYFATRSNLNFDLLKTHSLSF